jgi:hypothetical protein
MMNGWASIDEFAFVGLHPKRLRMRHRSGHEFEFALGPTGWLGRARRVGSPAARCSAMDLANLEAAATHAVQALLA